jgi:hypothetical protein
MTLEQIKKWAEDIAGSWNGDESGSQEDRAHQANEILEKIAELETLIEEMDDL